MSARTASRALRSSLKHLNRSSLQNGQQRTYLTAALNAGRTGAVRQAAKPIVAGSQQIRGVKTVDFAGVKEEVYGRFMYLFVFDNNLYDL